MGRPRVGLLSNGEEAAQRGGSALAACEIERRSWPGAGGAGVTGAFEFVGNVEGGDLVAGVADVVVTDGLTGNIALKLMEGVSQTILGAIRDAAMSSTRAKLGGALLRAALRGLRAQIDPEARAAPTCSGCAGSGWCRTAGSPARGLRPGDPARPARRPRGSGRQHPPALEQAGALRRSPVSARTLACRDNDVALTPRATCSI